MKKAKDTLSNFVYLFRMMKSCSSNVFYLLLVQIPIKVLMPFLGILLSKLVVQILMESGDVRMLMGTIAGTGALLVAGAFFDQYTVGAMQVTMSLLQNRLESMVMENEVSSDYGELERKSRTGIFEEALDYIWRNNSYIPRSAENMVELFAGFLGFALYVTVLAKLHIGVLALIIATTVVSFWFADLGAKQKKKMGWNVATRYITKLHEVSAQPGAGKDIRLYGMEKWFEDKFRGYLLQSRQLFHGKIARKNFLSGLIDAAMRVLRDGVVYGYLVYILYQHKIGLPDFVMITGSIAGFSGWVTKIAVQISGIGQMSTEISVIRSCLNENEGTGTGLAVEEELEEISFDHVSFRYPGSEQWVLDDISFRIKKGEKLALVGMNGAGKTTCIKLMCGLLMPTSGKVLVNGRDASVYGRKEYYRLFSTVFQDSVVLPVSIKENVAQKKEIGDMERVKECIDKAGLKKKVEGLPDGYGTLLVPELNSEGIMLSGGEMQRIMLARAIYKEAQVLILDEPTAALDPIAENNIYMEYNRLVNGKISVFISHRLASTRFCDRILLLKGGKIVEEGTHEQLLERNGEYAGMFAVQSYYYQESMS